MGAWGDLKSLRYQVNNDGLNFGQLWRNHNFRR